MGSRVLIQILILLAPFAIYGVYRIALAEAAAEGKRPWPVQRLFLIGFVLTSLAFVGFYFFNERVCREESRMIDGQIVQGKIIPCERSVDDIGIPANDDPGGRSVPEEPAGGGDG